MKEDNYGYKIEVDSLEYFGRSIQYKAIGLNSILYIRFLQLNEVESLALRENPADYLSGLPYGFLILPSNELTMHYMLMTDTPPNTGDVLKTHAFFVPREQFTFFLGELNVLDVMAKPEHFGIWHIDRLEVIRFIYKHIVQPNVLPSHIFKHLDYIPDDS
ncbi:hypothetical protein ACFFLM_08330 [Deinococcus oregonensis]|uniref:Uncharacterized protein n=1 Tax=Deinococcus oregonensis TaxID=1805970 RepID=A0ABV6AWS0_9DEIO